MKTWALSVVLTFALCLLNACGGSKATPPPPAAPMVTIAATSGAITLGQKVTLTWTSTDATSCTASANPSQSDWSGPEPVSGSASVTPAAPGTITYTLGCTGVGGSASHDAPVAVSIGPLSIPPAAPPDGTVGSRYNPHLVCTPGCACNQKLSCWRTVYGFPLSATGGLAPYSWSWAAAAGSSLPPNLNVTNSQIAGTPSQTGSYGVIVTVTDSQSPAVSTGASYTITINNPPPPAINTSPAPPAGAKNLPYSYTFTASGFAPLTWSETGAIPPGLTFGNDGRLSGTPTTLGAFPLFVIVTDGVGQTSATDDVTVEIFPHGFKATGSMASAREGHTATLLPNGNVLVAGGLDDTNAILATAELFDPASGSFISTGSMTNARYDHTATLLPNGKVLVAGGDNVSGETAELFDVASGSFATTGSLTTPRVGHTATLLSNGKVLIIGGVGGASTLDSAELFDPSSGTFTLTGSMTSARAGHTAMLLANGKVLVTGGMDGNGAVLASAELFDPGSGTFVPTGAMTAARQDHQATLLNTGEVLITGGMDSSTALNSAELFNPASGTFATTGSMAIARSGARAILLQDGSTVVIGGSDVNGQSLGSAELSAVSGTSFSGTGSLTRPRREHAATLLDDGRVLVTGGTDDSDIPVTSAELYQ